MELAVSKVLGTGLPGEEGTDEHRRSEGGVRGRRCVTWVNVACRLFGEPQGIQVSEVDDMLVESSYRCPSTVHSFSSWPWESSVGYKMLFKNMKVYLSSSLSLPVCSQPHWKTKKDPHWKQWVRRCLSWALKFPYHPTQCQAQSSTQLILYECVDGWMEG